MSEERKSGRILGLDVSTKTIGIALFEGDGTLMELTNITPVIKPKPETKLEELFKKVDAFEKLITRYIELDIEKVVIEEPLLNSNNVYTIQTLLRFNTLICKEVYDVLGIIPDFISTYNSRKFAWPDLVQLNDKGKHVLFGGLPKDVDKKMLIWEKVAKREPQITWHYTKNNTLKKENFDQTDAYTCVLGYMRQNEIWQ